MKMIANRIGIDATRGKKPLRNSLSIRPSEIQRARYLKGRSPLPITSFLALLVTTLLGGCSGGDNSNPDTDAPGITAACAGVKGSLAGTFVNLYQVDLSATDPKGSTDAAAAITPSSIPSKRWWTPSASSLAMTFMHRPIFYTFLVTI
jgi:hypothetical protein